MSEYPEELVERARYEVRVFDRVAQDTGIELISEVERLRAENATLRKQAERVRAWIESTCPEGAAEEAFRPDAHGRPTPDCAAA